MKFYGYFRSSAAFRVRIALNMKGLAYEQVSVHLGKGKQHEPEFAAISPQNLVPVLEHEGRLLYQSLPILQFLDEVYPSPQLLPRDPYERNRVRSLALIVAAEIHPLNNVRVLGYLTDTLKVSDEQRQASIDRSSLLNDAYRTLRNPVTRAQYLLSIEGYKEAEKKAPPDLLEEVFELNMQIEEMKAARRSGDEAEIVEARSALEDALAGLNRKLAELDARLARTGEEWDASLDKPDSGGEAEGRAALNRLSEVLSHRSYIRNLVRDIKEEIL